MPLFLDQPDNNFLAYEHSPGTTPGVVFCPGFHSEMSGNKALFLERHCREQGRQFCRFDYYGHGQSSGNVEDGTIGLWLQNTLDILDTVTEGEQHLVGSSMGGWLMLLAAKNRPMKISALVGIAPAPDMTGFKLRRLPGHQQALLDEQGWLDIPNNYDDRAPYRVRKSFFEEAKRHYVLHRAIPLNIPVQILHGLDDQEVPWQRSMELVEKLESRDVVLQLVKNGDHRLSGPDDLQHLKRALNGILAASSPA